MRHPRHGLSLYFFLIASFFVLCLKIQKSLQVSQPEHSPKVFASDLPSGLGHDGKYSLLNRSIQASHSPRHCPTPCGQESYPNVCGFVLGHGSHINDNVGMCCFVLQCLTKPGHGCRPKYEVLRKLDFFPPSPCNVTLDTNGHEALKEAVRFLKHFRHLARQILSQNPELALLESFCQHDS